MMDSFLQNLFEHGRVRVGHPDKPVLSGDNERSADLLVEFERVRRLTFPGEPPLYSPAVGLWAARQFYRACQAATFRDIASESLPRFFAASCPVGEISSLHYSVDLTFQFLPDFRKLIVSFAAGDPLADHIQSWANQWPLSSIGMKDVVPISLDGIVKHPGLLQYYVDRVISKRDTTRFSDPRVRAVARRTLATYQELFPELGQVDRHS